MKQLLTAIFLFLAANAFCQLKLSENTGLQGVLLGTKPLFVDTIGNLWTTDGTPANTKIYTTKVKLDDDGGAIVLNNKLYFSGIASATGSELWCTDGTDAGTFLVKDIHNGAPSSQPADFFLLNNKIYFGANDGPDGYELWTSDGSGGGTHLVKDITPGANSTSFSFPYINSIALGGTGFFIANDGEHGYELWKTDGTAGGTSLVKDINPNNAGTGIYGIFDIEKLGNSIYFFADDGEHGYELWKSNGFEAGTSMVKDIVPGEDGSGTGGGIHIFKNKMYFSINTTAGNAVELWTSDGTENGTQKVKTMPAALNYNSIELYEAVDFPSNFLFTFLDDNKYEVWTSDGSETGTKKLVAGGSADYISIYNKFDPFFDEQHTPPFNGKVFVQTNNYPNNGKLLLTDGTEVGTTLVKNVGTDYSYLYGANTFYFFGYDPAKPDSTSLFKTDGTTAGTFIMQSFPIPKSGNGGGDQYIDFEWNGDLYYTASDSPDGSVLSDLYKSNGSVTPPPTNTIYTFIGNGSWENAANWKDNLVPPANLTSGEIIIDPVPGGECVANSVKTISSGAKLTVKGTKKLRFVK